MRLPSHLLRKNTQQELQNEESCSKRLNLLLALLHEDVILKNNHIAKLVLMHERREVVSSLFGVHSDVIAASLQANQSP